MGTGRGQFTWIAWVASTAIACILLGSTSRAQTYWTRVFLGDDAPRPIERGKSPDLSHAPGTIETRRRSGVRAQNRLIDRTGLSGTPYVPGRVIVKFRDGTTGASRLSTMSALKKSSALTSKPSYADFDVVQIGMADDAEAVAEEFRQRPEVEYAQPSYRLQSKFVPNDPFYRDGSQWNLSLVHLERAWDIQPTPGSAITVAVLDTGIAYKASTLRMHANAFTLDADGFVGPPSAPGPVYPALGDLTLSYVAATQLAPSTRFVAPFDFIWNDASPLDFDGHGTHVSGTIGQTTNDGVGTAGVAFNVKLMPVKVLDSNWDNIFGAPNFASDDILARGIRYAADNGAKVINMSLGRTGPPAPVVEAAMRYAVGRGVFIATAAGNEFEDGNPVEVIAEIASRIKGAVSVGAVDPRRNHAPYSNTGSYIELVAPGGSFDGFDADGGVLQQTLDLDLVETYTSGVSRYTAPRFDSLAYYYFTGTSQATPHVAGLAAMLMQQGITNPAAVEEALENGAMDLGAHGRDNTFGFGLIEAYGTLRGLGLARVISPRSLGLALVAGLCWTSAGEAQVTRAPAPAPPRPAASPGPTFTIRPFGMAAGEFFTAHRTFDAIFSVPVQPFVGAGVQLLIHRRFVIEATASWWQKQGERAFLSDGQVFPLGIPITANLIPAEFGVGYRFHTNRRLIPYATVGAGWYTYREDPNTNDAVVLQHAGYLANVGFEYRLGRSLALTVDAQGTYVPGILGTGGISEVAGENDLGGIAGRVRLVFGR